MSRSHTPLDLATDSSPRYDLPESRLLELGNNMIVACAAVLNEQRKFYEHFPAWKKVREESIKNLRINADLLDKQKRKATITRLVGSSTSIFGGIASVTSAATVLVPLVPLVAAPLVVAAPALLMTAGTVASLGSIVKEQVSKKSKVKAVQSILENDGKETERLKPYHERNRNLISVIESVMSIDVFQEFVDELQNLLNQIMSINVFQEFVDELQNLFPDRFKLDDPNPDACKIQATLDIAWPLLLRSLVLDPRAEIALSFLVREGHLTKLLSMFKWHKNSHLLAFESISATIKIASMFAPVASGYFHAAATAQNVHLARNPLVRNSRRPGPTVGIGKAVLSVGVVLDCYAVYRAIEDLRKKSPSPCAAKIRLAADELEEELRNFTIAYDMMKNIVNI